MTAGVLGIFASFAIIRTMLRRILRPLWLLLALLFLVEAWLWSHLEPIVGWLVDLIAWRKLKERAAAAIERLPPAATLVVFVIPGVLLFPLKLAGLWMLAHGSWLGAMAVLALAKLISMGVTAFIFEVTKPKLLQLAWFRWLYEHVLMGLAWAHRQIDPLKERLRAWLRETLAPWVRRLRSLLWLLAPQRSGRFLRRVIRIRKRMQRPA
jgi:hypothetical protein